MTMHRGKAEMSAKGDVAESDVSARMGLDQRTLAGIRAELEYGLHWHVHNRVTMWTEAGIEHLKKTLGVDEAAAVGPITPPDGCGGGLEKDRAASRRQVSLQVFGCCRNPTWVEAWTHDDRKVLVRVKNNRGMWRGYNLHGCEEKADGRFEYHGRCPAVRSER